MQLILNPPYEDIKRYGTLAYVPQGERNRVLNVMTAKGLLQYCNQVEAEIERRKKK